MRFRIYSVFYVEWGTKQEILKVATSSSMGILLIGNMLGWGKLQILRENVHRRKKDSGRTTCIRTWAL